MEQFNQYFVDTLKNSYADFDGKATLSQYWYFVLFSVLVIIVSRIIDTYAINPMLGMNVQEATRGGLLQVPVTLALLIPFIAIGVRRLHDIEKSGWWMMISLTGIGLFVLLYFFVQKSK